MNITLSEIADAVNGVLCGNGDKRITQVSFDSRSCTHGTLFAALKGERRDGHEFIPSLVGSGAAVLCGKKTDCQIDAVIVEDVPKALSELALWYKENKCCLKKTVAVTGSVGKTTTKDMTACVVSCGYNTHKTQGNYNNALGVPMTLFGLDNTHEILVSEMGMSGFGEIQGLSNIARPDIGMITNIGTSHIEMLGSRENIAKAKLEIVSGMKKGATLILNGDEPLLREGTRLYMKDYKVVFVGLGGDNDIYARNIKADQTTQFEICCGSDTYSARLFVAGEHNVYNALFAFAAGVECGIAPQRAAKAISEFRSYGMRQNVIEKNGIKIIADCYNASRESMCASLKVLCGGAYKAKRKIAVLGEMLELGEKSREFHRDVGICAAQEKPDMLFVLSGAAEICSGALEKGYPADRCIYCDSKETLYTELSQTLREGDAVLFKASRGIKLEEIINKLGFEIK